jgi:hypothetical protein
LSFLLKYRSDNIDTRRNGQPPKSQLTKNTNHSILVILCSG